MYLVYFRCKYCHRLAKNRPFSYPQNITAAMRMLPHYSMRDWADIISLLQTVWKVCCLYANHGCERLRDRQTNRPTDGRTDGQTLLIAYCIVLCAYVQVSNSWRRHLSHGFNRQLVRSQAVLQSTRLNYINIGLRSGHDRSTLAYAFKVLSIISRQFSINRAFRHWTLYCVGIDFPGILQV